MITIQQVNRDFAGNPGKLIGQQVETPKGRGKIRAVHSGFQRTWFAHVSVMPATSMSRNPRGKRHTFSFDQLTLIQGEPK